MNIDTLKKFTENGNILVEMLNKKFDFDISNSCYFSDEEIGVFHREPSFVLDIGVDETGLYSYYFKEFYGDTEMTGDDRYITGLHSDLVIARANEIYNLKDKEFV